MNNNSFSASDMVIIGLAIVGAIVLLPSVIGLTFGLMGLIIRLAAWMFAGALAGRMMRGAGYGPIRDIGLGIIGGVIGTLLFTLIGLGGFANSLIGGIIVGAVGAVVFIWVVRLIFKADFAR